MRGQTSGPDGHDHPALRAVVISGAV